MNAETVWKLVVEHSDVERASVVSAFSDDGSTEEVGDTNGLPNFNCNSSNPNK